MPTGSSDLSEMIAELSRLLWQELRVLERLRYCLRVQDLMLDGDDADSLVMAVDDVQVAIDSVAELEAARTDLSMELGAMLDLGTQPTLQQLIDEAPPPFDEMLADHRDSFLRVVGDITSTSLNSRDHVQRGLNMTQDLVRAILGDSGDGGYDARGDRVTGTPQRRLLDQQL